MFNPTNYGFPSPKVSHYEGNIPARYDAEVITHYYYEDSERNRKRRFTPWGVFCCIICGLFLVGIVIAAILMGVLIKPNTTLSTNTTSRITNSTVMTITTTHTTTVTTTYTTTVTTTITTTDIPCVPQCNSEQRCIQGVCVGTGYLSFTLGWSRPGDGDIVVATPDNKIIHFDNKGPSVNTSQGQLDVDNQNGTGPENIFWSNSSIPPLGTYYVCFSQYNFSSNASVTNPITATVTIERLSNTPLIFTKTFTSPYRSYTVCDSTSVNLLGSFAYP